METGMKFTAPGAKILVVDDNSMNRRVTSLALAGLQIEAEVAESGEQALRMLEKKCYHIVFMDYMMPVMDGAETTKRLRRMEGEYYQKLPVIALTANSDKNLEQNFFAAGINDVLEKPVDMQQLYRMLDRWLPQGMLQQKSTGGAETEKEITDEELQEAGIAQLQGLHVREGVKNAGGIKLFVSLLGEFYQVIEVKAARLEEYLAQDRIKDYTIEVHALKSTARMIGAPELSEQFKQLEMLGNAGETDKLKRLSPVVLHFYRSYREILKPFGEEKTEKRQVPREDILLYLRGMQEAAEALDLDLADEAMRKLLECVLPEECTALMIRLKAAVADVSSEEIIDITEEIIEFLF